LHPLQIFDEVGGQRPNRENFVAGDPGKRSHSDQSILLKVSEASPYDVL
jgi:hypothetical protein